MSEPLTSAIKCDKCEQGSQVTWEAYHAGWYHCESRHWGFTLTRCPRHTASSVPASDVHARHEAAELAAAQSPPSMQEGESEKVLELLRVAGFVREDKYEQALAIVRSWPAQPRKL